MFALLFFGLILFNFATQHGFNNSVINVFESQNKQNELVVETIEPIIDGHWECIEREARIYSNTTYLYFDKDEILGNITYTSKNWIYPNSSSGEYAMYFNISRNYWSEEDQVYYEADFNLSFQTWFNKSVCTKETWVKG